MHDQDDDGPAGRLRAELRSRRRAAGLSQGELADRIRYSREYLNKVESGAKFPPETLVAAVDRELSADGVLTGLRDRAWKARRAHRHDLPPPPDERDERDEGDEANRREALKLGGLALAAATAADVSRRIASASADPHPLAVDELEVAVAALAERYPTAPHATLTAEASRLWHGAEVALDRRLSLRVRARVVRAAGTAAYYVGRLAFNLSEDAVAMPFAALAAQHADDIGHPTLIASVAALRSSVAYWQGRYPAALDYLADVERSAPAHLTARIATYEARAHAAMGNMSAALEASNRMLATAGEFPIQMGSTSVGPAVAALSRAQEEITFGNAREAERWARCSVDAFQPGAAEYTLEERLGAVLTLSRAVMLGDRPDVEQAAENGRLVLRELADHPTRTVAVKVHKLWALFDADHRRVPSVAAFGSDLASTPLALPAGTSA